MSRPPRAYRSSDVDFTVTVAAPKSSSKTIRHFQGHPLSVATRPVGHAQGSKAFDAHHRFRSWRAPGLARFPAQIRHALNTSCAMFSASISPAIFRDCTRSWGDGFHPGLQVGRKVGNRRMEAFSHAPASVKSTEPAVRSARCLAVDETSQSCPAAI